MWAFLSTIFLSVFGAVVAFSFQTRSWKAKHRSDTFEREREAALNVVQLLSESFDKRYHAQRTLLAVLNNQADEAKIHAANASYESYVITWMSGVSAIKAKLTTYFDEELASSFHQSIVQPFRRSDDGIQLRLRHGWDLNTRDKEIAADALQELSSARHGFEGIQRCLLERIESGDFGTPQTWDDVHSSRLSDISFWHLVFRLFDPARK